MINVQYKKLDLNIQKPLFSRKVEKVQKVRKAGKKKRFQLGALMINTLLTIRVRMNLTTIKTLQVNSSSKRKQNAKQYYLNGST
jgi:hypothetical protein